MPEVVKSGRRCAKGSLRVNDGTLRSRRVQPWHTVVSHAHVALASGQDMLLLPIRATDRRLPGAAIPAMAGCHATSGQIRLRLTPLHLCRAKIGQQHPYRLSIRMQQVAAMMSASIRSISAPTRLHGRCTSPQSGGSDVLRPWGEDISCWAIIREMIAHTSRLKYEQQVRACHAARDRTGWCAGSAPSRSRARQDFLVPGDLKNLLWAAIMSTVR